MGLLYSKNENIRPPYEVTYSNISQESRKSAYYYIAQKSSKEHRTNDDISISLSLVFDRNLLRNKDSGIVYDKHMFEVMYCGTDDDLNFIRDKALRY